MIKFYKEKVGEANKRQKVQAASSFVCWDAVRMARNSLSSTSWSQTQSSWLSLSKCWDHSHVLLAWLTLLYLGIVGEVAIEQRPEGSQRASQSKIRYKKQFAHTCWNVGTLGVRESNWGRRSCDQEAKWGMRAGTAKREVWWGLEDSRRTQAFVLSWMRKTH